MEIKEVCKYFNNCKEKYIRRFEEKTPDGNFIKGYICTKSNRYLGSLLITELNGEPHNQFVQSMPKIEYFMDDRDIVVYDDNKCTYNSVNAYEKLDGSCLILYPILDENGYIIEVVPKTRGKAVADKHFIDLYMKIDRSAIWNYYKNNKGILFFEMFGILNQHDIIHYQTGIDLRLIGCYTTRFFKSEALLRLCSKYGFKQPDKIFEVHRIYNGYRIDITSEKYQWYFDDVKREDRIVVTIHDAIAKIQFMLEYLNKTYEDMYGRFVTEGVVLNCTTQHNYQKYIKIKPRDIEAKHRSERGIPKSAIQKEVLKYFDDYGSVVDELYKTDENHHTEYIHRMLSEDYSPEIIQKSKKKIEKIFMQIWDSKQIPVSIHTICDELIAEYGDQGIKHCMRMFAQKYPSKRKDARTVYNALEIKFNQQGLEL